jgi:uncharacterized membrane protein
VTHKIALVVLVTISPISELRGGIPLGISLGLDPLLTFFVAIIANAIVFFPILLVLRLFYDSILCRLQIFNRYLDSVRRKGKPKVDKYGSLALVLFVAIPLPVTGVYTASILSWLLDMHWRKAFPAIALGVIIAGIIVLLITLGTAAGMKFFAPD